MKNLAKVHKTNRLLMVIFCKEIYFVSYQQTETLEVIKLSMMIFQINENAHL